MKNYDIEKIRTIAVVGPQSSGKTSFMESVLHVTDVKGVKGTVEAKNTTSDFLQEEKDHTSSYSASVIPVEYEGYKFNFIDTPGARGLINEVNQTLSVVKGAVMIVDGQRGIDLQTEEILQKLNERNVPTFVFVNKMDNENVKWEKVLEGLQGVLENKAVPFLYPVTKGDDFRGYINLVSMKKRELENGKVVDKVIDDEYMALIEESRENIVESVAMSSEDLLEKHFEGIALTQEEIVGGLREGILNGDLKPIVMGSALDNIGVRDLLEMFEMFMPAPNDLKAKAGMDPDTAEKIRRKTVDDAPFSGYVFKTSIDPYIGTMNYIKVYSGTVKSGDKLYNPITKETVKVNQLTYIRGKEQLDTDVIGAGDIGILVKLDGVLTGHTLCDPKAPIIYRGSAVPTPTIYVAVSPKQKRDEDKISSALHKLILEDPAFEYKRNPETSQLLVGGQGMAHVNYQLEKLQNIYGVEVDILEQKIVYRETIKKTVEALGRHKKQSGGSGQFGVVNIRFEPMDPNKSDFEFAEEVHGGSVPKGYFPAVEKGLQEHFVQGPLAGFPVIGVRAVLYDGKYHPVDSNEISFKIAAAIAFKEAVKTCGPTLLEPVMKLEIYAHDDYVGDVMGDINKRRGKVLGMEPQIGGKQKITAEVPEAEIVSYAIDLNQMTQGTGMFSREFIRYEEVPHALVGKIVEQVKRDQEEK